MADAARTVPYIYTHMHMHVDIQWPGTVFQEKHSAFPHVGLEMIQKNALIDCSTT